MKRRLQGRKRRDMIDVRGERIEKNDCKEEQDMTDVRQELIEKKSE